MAQAKLTRLVPIENAAMEERRMIQWDKDDMDALGLMKVDVLALGMLAAMPCAFDLGRIARQGKPHARHPAQDAATYDMMCQADTVGVFQIEPCTNVHAAAFAAALLLRLGR